MQPLKRLLTLNHCTLRGHRRIRTAVKGFADPCLTARPYDHLNSRTNIGINFYYPTILVD
jgi:hypothetical protein